MATDIGQELASVPFAEMVYQLGSAIANAQTELDKNSIDILREMGDIKSCPVELPIFNVENEGTAMQEGEGIKTSMIGAGFQPTFYQFAESIIEVKMTITATNSTENTESGTRQTTTTTTTSRRSWPFNRKTTTRIVSSPINATYTNKYNYTAEGTSLLRTRLVPMPPNATIQRLIDLKAQYLTLNLSNQIKKVEDKLAKEEEKQQA